ncbi:T9SS type A sorting domain-containing protein [bacterium SCSIO 12741]|nr:T9SS type A sorting domain-containing protein [bacterium SCSIO 12741]
MLRHVLQLLLICLSVSPLYAQQLEQVTFFEEGKQTKSHSNVLDSKHGLVIHSGLESAFGYGPQIQTIGIFKEDSFKTLFSSPYLKMEAVSGDHALISYGYSNGYGEKLAWLHLVSGEVIEIELGLGDPAYVLRLNKLSDRLAFVYSHGATFKYVELEEGKSAASFSTTLNNVNQVMQMVANDETVAMVVFHPDTDGQFRMDVMDRRNPTSWKTINKRNSNAVNLDAGKTRIYFSDSELQSQYELKYIEPQTLVEKNVEPGVNGFRYPMVFMAREDTVYYEWSTADDSIHLRRFEQNIETLYATKKADFRHTAHFHQNSKDIFYSRKNSGRYTTWVIEQNSVKPIVGNYAAAQVEVDEIGLVYFFNDKVRIYYSSTEKVADYSMYLFYNYQMEMATYNNRLYWVTRVLQSPRDYRIEEFDPIQGHLGDINDQLLDQPYSKVAELSKRGNVLYFEAYQEETGDEPWYSTGIGKEALLADVRPGKEGSHLARFQPTENGMFFMANNGNSGYQLWRAEGSQSKQISWNWSSEDSYQGTYPYQFIDFGYYNVAGTDWFTNDKGVPYAYHPQGDKLVEKTEFDQCKSIGAYFNQPLFHRIYREEGQGNCHYFDSYRNGRIRKSCSGYHNFYPNVPGITWGGQYLYVDQDEEHGPEIWTYQEGKGASLFQELVPGNNIRVDDNPMHGYMEYRVQPQILGANKYAIFATGEHDFWIMKAGEANFTKVDSKRRQWYIGDRMVYSFSQDSILVYDAAEASWSYLTIPVHGYGDWVGKMIGDQLFFSVLGGKEWWSTQGTAQTTYQVFSPVENNLIVDRQQMEWMNGYMYFAANKEETGTQLFRFKLALEPALGSPVSETERLSIYPNPAVDYLQVRQVPEGETTTLHFFNLQGQEVYTFETREDGFVDVSQMQSGWYLVRYEINGESRTDKIQIAQ